MEPGPSPAPRCRRVPRKKTQRAGRTRATDPRYPAWRALLRLRARSAATGHPPRRRGHSRRQPSCFDEFTKKQTARPPHPEKKEMWILQKSLPALPGAPYLKKMRGSQHPGSHEENLQTQLSHFDEFTKKTKQEH